MWQLRGDIGVIKKEMVPYLKRVAYSEGVNFEGPAPRPMDRANVQLAPDGQIIVDTSRLYSWPKGQPSHFNDPGSFLPV